MLQSLPLTQRLHSLRHEISLVSPFYRPGVGGSSRLLHDVVLKLVQDGHEVVVLTYQQGEPAACRAFDEAEPYLISRIPPQKGNGLSSLFMLARIVSLAARHRFDLILCGVAFPSAVLVYVATFVTRIPYAVYSYGEDVTMVQGASRKTALLTNALRSARRIMTISRFTQGEIERLGISSEKIALIPPGIDPLLYEQTPARTVEALRSRLGLQNKRIILTLARLTPRKGHDMILRALPDLCDKMPDLHYLIVGKGDPADLLALAEAEGIADRVTIIPFVEDFELPALYHLCELYAMVSRWDPVLKEVEGFGICFLEAAACGKPCVAGSAGGSQDAVEEGVTALVVDPTSLTEIKDALQILLTDPDQAAAMGEAGRRRVRDSFDRDALLQKVEHVLISSLPQSRLRPPVL